MEQLATISCLFTHATLCVASAASTGNGHEGTQHPSPHSGKLGMGFSALNHTRVQTGRVEST